MARRVWLLFALAAWPLEAQLSEQPATWTEQEGRYLHDAPLDDVRLLWLTAGAWIAEAREQNRLPVRVAALIGATSRAAGANDANTAWRLITRLLSAIRGDELGEYTEVASAIDFHLDRSIVPHGQSLHAAIDPVFTLDRQLKHPYRASIRIEDPGGKLLWEARPLEIGHLEHLEVTVPAAALRPGKWVARYELASANQVLATAARPFMVDAEVEAGIAALREKLRKVAASGAAARSFSHNLAYQTAEFYLELLNAATRSYLAPYQDRLHPQTIRLRQPVVPWYGTALLDMRRDLGWAGELLDGLLAGADPLGTRRGELRVAMRMSDGSVEPFRLYVPAARDKAPALLVLLRAATGDEGSWLEHYRAEKGGPAAPALAEERGYVLLSPYGRGPFTGFTERAGTDVDEAIDAARKLFPQLGTALFIAGHSLGGTGALLLAAQRKPPPAGVAAAGALAGALPQLEKSGALPVLFVLGAKDLLAPAAQARIPVERARRSLPGFRYLELPGADQAGIGAAALTPMFDFFDELRARPAQKP